MEIITQEFETSIVDGLGRIISQTSSSARILRELLGKQVLLEMAFIPGGIFKMGSPGRQGYPDEHPQHIVSMAPFWIGRQPITQEQWQRVIKKLPPCRFKGPRLPVDNVSWEDAQLFCSRLSKKTGRVYRLPAEAEWEIACRAGSESPFYFGETITTDLANYVGEHIYLAESKGIYRHTTTEAGCFPPNAFGLYDMHGNVWEWCADAWHDDYQGAPFDGSVWDAADKKTSRVLRGGCWHEIPGNCRSAVRLKANAEEREDFFGLRVALKMDFPQIP
jgi:formylglycine-generating enzyme required for sulfatase activity